MEAHIQDVNLKVAHVIKIPLRLINRYVSIFLIDYCLLVLLNRFDKS